MARNDEPEFHVDNHKWSPRTNGDGVCTVCSLTLWGHYKHHGVDGDKPVMTVESELAALDKFRADKVESDDKFMREITEEIDKALIYGMLGLKAPFSFWPVKSATTAANTEKVMPKSGDVLNNPAGFMPKRFTVRNNGEINVKIEEKPSYESLEVSCKNLNLMNDTQRKSIVDLQGDIEEAYGRISRAEANLKDTQAELLRAQKACLDVAKERDHAQLQIQDIHRYTEAVHK